MALNEPLISYAENSVEDIRLKILFPKPLEIDISKIRDILKQKFENVYSDPSLAAQHRMSNGDPVDAVIVWELPETDKQEVYFQEVENALQNTDRRMWSEEVKKFYRRHFFEKSLRNEGLSKTIADNKAMLAYWGPEDPRSKQLKRTIDIQEKHLNSRTLNVEYELGADAEVVFVKISAPFTTLLHVAEEVNLVLPLQDDGTMPTSLQPQSFLDQVFYFTKFYSDDIQDESTYCAEFRMAYRERFINHDDPTKFFTPAQRSMLVMRVLQDTPYDHPYNDNEASDGDDGDDGISHNFGINRMLHRKIYQFAFPLHEELESHGDVQAITDPIMQPQRPILANTWARWSLWYKMQPVNRVRLYFGEVVAFYFLWLGFYTRMLAVAAFVGFAVFIYGLCVFQHQEDAQEVCDSKLIMCGQCDACSKWRLSSSCEAYQFSYIFDNPGTVFFAFFMAVWATVFLEFWKRETSVKAFEWDVSNFRETEPYRPEFVPRTHKPDPVTSQPVPYFPNRIRLVRIVVSVLVVALMLTLVIWAVIAVILFRLGVQMALYERYPSETSMAPAVTSSLAALLNLISIQVLAYVYEILARNLTDWENFEHQSEHEQALSIKMALFNFVNSYSSIAYIAFFKGQFAGTPGNPGQFLGVNQESCPQYGCLLELTIQLAIIMVGNQFIGNCKDFLIPKIKEHIRKKKYEEETKEFGLEAGRTPWERQMLLEPVSGMGMFDSYLKMATQYGFVTLFVAAFPLGPFCALVNNLFQIRLDAKKQIFELQRPFAARCEDIGVWYSVLLAISYCAVITNAFVIAIPSSFIPKQVYKYSHDDSLIGYTNMLYAPSPITSSNPSDGQANCSYVGFRNAHGDYTAFYYQVMMARLAFVIAFEHVVFLVKLFLQFVIPDVPYHVQLAQRREQHLARVALEQALASNASALRLESTS